MKELFNSLYAASTGVGVIGKRDGCLCIFTHKHIFDLKNNISIEDLYTIMKMVKTPTALSVYPIYKILQKIMFNVCEDYIENPGSFSGTVDNVKYDFMLVQPLGMSMSMGFRTPSNDFNLTENDY